MSNVTTKRTPTPSPWPASGSATAWEAQRMRERIAALEAQVSAVESIAGRVTTLTWRGETDHRTNGNTEAERGRLLCLGRLIISAARHPGSVPHALADAEAWALPQEVTQ